MNVSRLLFALGALLVVSQVLRQAAIRLRQPPVVGEIIAGIALGPSILGAAWPSAQHWLFPSAVMPELAALATIGITLFMFDVGLNLDLAHLRNASGRLVFLGGWNVAIPFCGGCALGVATASAYRGAHSTTLAFVLFMGVAMSITAFPVLARILDETGMSRSELAAKALAIAALGDVAAWVLLAGATAAAKGDHPWHAVVVLGELLAVAVGWLVVGRRMMAMRAWGLGVMMATALILGGLTDFIGVHAIFGGFMAGVVVPRAQAELVSARMSTVVQTLLLPVFFVVTGLQTSLGLLHSGRDAMVLLGCLLVAIVGKLGGMSLGTRLTGTSWRESFAMGTLMNTRGLTELVVLAVGLNLGVLKPDLFAVLVIVALVTTAMTKPLLAMLGYTSSDATGGLRRAASVTARRRIDRPVVETAEVLDLTDGAVAAPR
jgi:K+:H+ antiporter